MEIFFDPFHRLKQARTRIKNTVDGYAADSVNCEDAVILIEETNELIDDINRVFFDEDNNNLLLLPEKN